MFDGWEVVDFLCSLHILHLNVNQIFMMSAILFDCRVTLKLLIIRHSAQNLILSLQHFQAIFINCPNLSF